MGIGMIRFTLKNHFQPETYAADGQFFSVKARPVQFLYIPNTCPVNPFKGYYPFCGIFPEYFRNMYSWVFLKKLSQVFCIMAFMYIVCFSLNDIG